MQRKAPSAPPPRGTTDRDKAVDALMALLAEHSFEEIGLAEVAGRAGLKLSELRAEFGSTLAIFAAHIKDIDRAVLAGGDADMAEEPARERLFDVLMRRLEALAPYKEAVRSMMRSARRNPGLALALNAMAVRSQRWMLEAAGIGASGPRGALARARRRADVRARARRLARRRRAKASTAPWPRSTAGSPAPSAGTVSSAICARCRNASCAGRAAAAVIATRKKWKRRKFFIPRRELQARASRNPGAADSELERLRFWVPRFALPDDGDVYTGTLTVARKPPSGLSPSVMSPPCERAMSRAIASPRPVPPSS